MDLSWTTLFLFFCVDLCSGQQLPNQARSVNLENQLSLSSSQHLHENVGQSSGNVALINHVSTNKTTPFHDEEPLDRLLDQDELYEETRATGVLNHPMANSHLAYPSRPNYSSWHPLAYHESGPPATYASSASSYVSPAPGYGPPSPNYGPPVPSYSPQGPNYASQFYRKPTVDISLVKPTATKIASKSSGLAGIVMSLLSGGVPEGIKLDGIKELFINGVLRPLLEAKSGIKSLISKLIVPLLALLLINIEVLVVVWWLWEDCSKQAMLAPPPPPAPMVPPPPSYAYSSPSYPKAAYNYM